MKRNITLLAMVILILCSVTVYAQTAFKSLNYLYSIQGSKTLSGQHNDQKDGTGASTYTDKVFSLTGKYPALYSADMLFHGNSQLRWDITYEAERQWNAGAVINFNWHVCPPTQGTVCNWDGGVLSSLTDAQWNDLLTNGGSLNITWKQRIDEISGYLQYLRDKGVEVLWRPLHEENQNSFWWSKSPGANYTQKLWRLTHDYMVNVKGLTNLIWVWDVQDLDTKFAEYNPGANYFDMAALDVYGDAYSNSTYYNTLLPLVGNKPIAIGECGGLPGADVLNNYPRYTFFMNWSYLLQQNNSDQYIRDVYNNPRVITRDEMPGWNSVVVPGNLAKGKNVTVSSTESGSANVAGNGVDGSYTTRWSSAYANNQNYIVDLGASYNLNRVKITWEAAFATDYQIQVSSDNVNWTTIKSVSGKSSSATDDFSGLTGTGRYLKIYLINRFTTYGFSFYELEVYGTIAGSGGNLALNKSVSTTSNENTTNTGPKAVDGNGTTRWSSTYANNQNFSVDLGANYNVNRVKINWEAAYAKDYQIQFSTDNVNWTTVKEFWGKSTAAADDYTGLSGVTRWVKVYCINRATAYGFSIYEFEVYGSSSSGRMSTTEAVKVAEVEDKDMLSAYPNPASGKTTLIVNLPEDGNAALNVMNALGKKITTVHEGFLRTGIHKFELSSEAWPTGVYLYTLDFASRRITKKLVKE